MLSPVQLQMDASQALLNVERMDWRKLSGAHIFLTGGTGFVGSWILQALVTLNETILHEDPFRPHITVLTRFPKSFIERRPWLATSQYVTLLEGDIETFSVKSVKGLPTRVIHAAMPDVHDPSRGTEHLVREIPLDGNGFMYISSGAVYDWNQPWPDYRDGKKKGETIVKSARPGAIVARLFSFAGPFFPLATHYAFPSFVRAALAREPIEVHGDGTQMRSYLYGADLGAWLLALLVKADPSLGDSNCYEIGSKMAISLLELAHVVATVLDGRKVNLQRLPETEVRERYVPNDWKTGFIGLRETFKLDHMILRMAKYHGWEG